MTVPPVFLCFSESPVKAIRPLLQVLGQLRCDVEALQADWVDEAQCLGLKSRPVEVFEDDMIACLQSTSIMSPTLL